MFSQIGPLEIIVVLVIVLLIFGPKRLPGLGRSLGSGMRNFKDSIAGHHDDEDDEERERERLELTKAKAAATAKATSDDPPAEERQVNEALGRSGD
ncbi:MAG TPA: twin-arginine translocase TatA/TatE family subunit [Solirubrobacteraceae bacterium]|nr:twin-arginine translocase TatA/TatE family subunit [Solirubrobacteraceae bacterium]